MEILLRGAPFSDGSLKDKLDTHVVETIAGDEGGNKLAGLVGLDDEVKLGRSRSIEATGTYQSVLTIPARVGGLGRTAGTRGIASTN